MYASDSIRRGHLAPALSIQTKDIQINSHGERRVSPQFQMSLRYSAAFSSLLQKKKYRKIPNMPPSPNKRPPFFFINYQLQRNKRKL